MKYILSTIIFVIIGCIGILIYSFIDLDLINDSTNEIKMKVIIEGAVNKPDSYYLNSKSILLDLVKKANGFKTNANLKKINLDEILKPNTVYIIPYEINLIRKVNLNAIQSSKELVESIKSYKLRISIADAIINHKFMYGSFKSWKEIDEIEGVGEKTLSELKKYFFIL